MAIASSISKAIPTGLKIPKSNGASKKDLSSGLKTKTPQDEALAFFAESHSGEPVQVWELWLEDDGGPAESKSVSKMQGRG